MSPRKPAVDPERILQAAAPIFERKGLAGATTKEIAAAAGVSEGSLYNHFASKREMFLACLRATERVEEIVRAIQRLPEDELEEGLRALGRALVAFMKQGMPAMMQVALAGETARLTRGPRADLALAERFFAPHVRAGRLRGDPVLLARCFLGLCQALAFQDRFFGFRAREQADVFIDVFLDGARVRPARERVSGGEQRRRGEASRGELQTPEREGVQPGGPNRFVGG